MKTIILTGYKGFIGGNLYKALKKREYDVFGFEEGCTIKDIEDCLNRLSTTKFEDTTIVHQGAITDTLYKDNSEMMRNNYLFSTELFDLALKNDINVVYASSAAIYGSGKEKTPINIYGWSKYASETYGILKFQNTSQKPLTGAKPRFVALRYFNVFGPNEENKGRMASVAYQAMKKGKFELFPKKPKRDFVYVEDVVRANIHAIENVNVKTGFYDVGSGKSHTFEYLCKCLDVPYIITSEDKIPKGYQFETKSSKSKFMPGWKPKYDLRLGLEIYKGHLQSRSYRYDIEQDHITRKNKDYE